MEKRKLLAKIRREFPGLTWKRAEHNVEGWDHYVIILDGKYVFRFPRGERYIKRLNNEVLLLQYLKNRVTISIPDYKYISKDKTFAGYQLIEGIQLKKKVFKTLPVRIKSVLAKQMADFLSTLHRTPHEMAKKYSSAPLNTQKAYRGLVFDIEKYVFPRFSEKDRLRTEEFLKELKNHLTFPYKVFAHSDLYSNHILLSNNKKSLSGIIDFSDRKINDPAIDFAELWDYGDDFVKDVYRYYQGKKDKDFLKRAVLYGQRVAFSEMISPLKGGPGSFTRGYRMFRERF